ncbi:MAG: translation initiation factor IF-2 [Holosporales bacterium]|nr:translation initiation factor IF-2 [Holosporales bacterium]
MSRPQRRDARTVTVEVRRKRVSLLEKKRAIEKEDVDVPVGTANPGVGASAGPADEAAARDNVHVGSLSSEEVNARVMAIKNAQKTQVYERIPARAEPTSENTHDSIKADEGSSVESAALSEAVSSVSGKEPSASKAEGEPDVGDLSVKSHFPKEKPEQQSEALRNEQTGTGFASSEAAAKQDNKEVNEEGGSWHFTPNSDRGLSSIKRVGASEAGNIAARTDGSEIGIRGNEKWRPRNQAREPRSPQTERSSTRTAGCVGYRTTRLIGGRDANWKSADPQGPRAPSSDIPSEGVILRDESYGRPPRELNRAREQRGQVGGAGAERGYDGERSRSGREQSERGEAGRYGVGLPVEKDGLGKPVPAKRRDGLLKTKDGALVSSEVRKTKDKHISDEADTVGNQPIRKGFKRSFDESGKLSRRVITRVLADEDEGRLRSVAAFKRAQKKRLMAGQKDTTQAKVIRDVIIPETITVGELASRMAVSCGALIKSLMKLGVTTSINQVIDADTAELACVEFGHRAKRISFDIEVSLRRAEDSQENKEARPPIVTVMGHVDHGKTSLLDALRETDIVSGESGRITQHIGAYQISVPIGGEQAKITFIDTPGHAAFSKMRARGAGVTDIVVLVVAADDGVKEQTIEAISHAKEAKVPIILAINKIDRPTADPQRVRSELLNFDVVTEDFGGDVMSVEISAKNGIHLDKLLEVILLQAELLNLMASRKGRAEGVVVEASIDKGRGASATLLVQHGTLRLGDVIVAGGEFGRIKTMTDSYGNKVKEATVSCPVEVLGFNGVPLAGDEFFVVEEESKARDVASYKKRMRKEKDILIKNKNSVADMVKRIAAGEVNELPIVLKTDVQGTLEALSNSIKNINIDGVVTRIVHTGIGGINETDIMLAKAAGAVIFGFHVKATPQAKLAAHKDKVSICYYSIVYDLLGKLEEMLRGRLAPVLEEQVLGRAEIRVVFSKGKFTKIAGCYVLDGLVKRANTQIRVIRQKDIVFTGEIDSMKREKDDIKEAKEGYECGIIIDGFNDIKEGDIIECFEIVKKAAPGS